MLAIVLALLLSIRPAQPGIGPANITNLSARVSNLGQPLDLPDAVPIAGFTITGTDPKQVVIRGLGPTLENFGLDELLDPKLALYDVSGNLIFSNNNWKDTQQAAIEATGLAPSFDVESAILITLQPGTYTAILTSEDFHFGFGGLGLVEIYDISPGVLAELTNISARGVVDLGDEAIIVGFITTGSTSVLLRGLGPTLSEFGIGVGFRFPFLADPVLTLVDGNGNIVQSNNNWKDTQQAAIQATGLAPPNDLEAAILVTVSAGNYTVILSGNSVGSGIGLVEVYKL